MTKQEEIQKAQGIIDSLDESMHGILDDVCQKSGVTPMDYVVNQLRVIESRKKYCQTEGIQYEEYRQTLFQEKMNGLFSSCKNAFLRLKKIKK